MRALLITRLVVAIGLVGSVSAAPAQSVAKAQRLGSHGLSAEAKVEYIAVLYATTTPASDKAEALYQLGQLAFAEGRYRTALADWAELGEKYPTNIRAKEVGERLAQLREEVLKGSEEAVSNAVAASYLRHGDFWSNAEDRVSIDASWLPSVTLANYWFDRVIAEYPGSDAAEVAYIRKVRTLLGWKETGQYGSAYGAVKDIRAFMPLVVATFDEFAAAFPKNSSLQALRFQIAQTYWKNKDWAETRVWLQRIVDAAGNQETFYSELAKARLAKVEY